MYSINKTLTDFGLSENEIKVYLACLNNDDLTPFKIAKLTGIPRTTVYDTLLNLSLKGLIDVQQSTGMEKQQTKVRAKNPFVLRQILEQRREEMFDLEADVVQILPMLKKSFLRHPEDNPDFQFFPGIEGMKQVYLGERDLESHVERFVFDNLMPMDVLSQEEINADIDRDYPAGKRSREIVPLNKWTKHVIGYQYQRNPKYLSERAEFRYLSTPLYNMRCRITLAGSFLRVSCAHQSEVWGMLINSRALTESVKSLFLLLWPQATPLTAEEVKSWGPNEYLEAEKKKGLVG